jgi:predicted O-linked N-acetylglucosamine transferase (SPINDLY family)
LRAEHGGAWRNLGAVLLDQARPDEAIAAYRRNLALDPRDRRRISDLLFCINYSPTLTGEEISTDYKTLGQRLTENLELPSGTAPQAAPRQVLAHPLEKGGVEKERLRIGYLSPDFRTHTVSLFLEPVLRAHDFSRVELFCYAEVPKPDETTERFRILAGPNWRSTVGMDTAAAVARIRADRLDVLVDLGGHSPNNRLDILAARAAPVQVAWLLGHGYGTGLAAVDVFLADAAMVPPGFEGLFTERVIRLDRIPLAYQPPPDLPEPGPSPMERLGVVTFGCFSRVVRINERVVVAWSRILKAVPGSRLLLNNRPFRETAMRAEMLARFARQGIPSGRIELRATQGGPETWAVYRDVDLALDPFPHNAGTTTIEALWMGIPVISLCGRPSVGRFGASILGSLGSPGTGLERERTHAEDKEWRLEEWLAAGEEEYIALAVARAREPDRLGRLRRHLRKRMAASPLCDAVGLARALEEVYKRLMV